MSLNKNKNTPVSKKFYVSGSSDLNIDPYLCTGDCACDLQEAKDAAIEEDSTGAELVIYELVPRFKMEKKWLEIKD